jgi:hypothetical protein
MRTMAGITLEPRAALPSEEPSRHDEAFAELGRGVQAALETYSNVHRLPLGLRALAVGRNALPAGAPFHPVAERYRARPMIRC